jgi:hypothetical protein
MCVEVVLVVFNIAVFSIMCKPLELVRGIHPILAITPGTPAHSLHRTISDLQQ